MAKVETLRQDRDYCHIQTCNMFSCYFLIRQVCESILEVRLIILNSGLGLRLFCKIIELCDFDKDCIDVDMF